MQVYEVLNYFDRTRYFVSVPDETTLINVVDEAFLKELKSITDDDGQYDDLRESKEERMEHISYTLLIEDATKINVCEHNLEGDLNKFYF